MKRLTWLSLLFSFLYPLCLDAQTYIDFKAGVLTIPLIKESDNHKYFSGQLNYSSSFSLALGLQHKHTKRFSTGIDLTYDFYRADLEERWYNPAGGQGQKNLSISMGYLVFSLFPQWNFGRKASFYFNAGPYFGFLMNSFSSGQINNKPTISDPAVNKEISGKAKNDVANSFIDLRIATGVVYNFTESLAAKFDICGSYGKCVVDTEIYIKQFDVTIYFGLLVKIGENRWKIN